jgi:hypothetical protein
MGLSPCERPELTGTLYRQSITIPCGEGVVREVGDKKRPCFHGGKGDAPAEPAAVGAGAGT